MPIARASAILVMALGQSLARRASLAALVTALSLLVMGGAPVAFADPTEPPADPTATIEPTDPSSPPSQPPPPTTPPTDPPTPIEPPPSADPGAPPPPADPGAPPPPFSEQINAASQGQEALAADAIRLSRLVFETEDQLARLELEAEATADIFRRAEADLARASQRAEQMRLAAVQAELELRIAENELESFARDSYINDRSDLSSAFLLLDSHGPRDLMDRAGLLELVAGARTAVLERVLAARQRSATASDFATAALANNLDVEAQARDRLDQSTSMLEDQQASLPDLLAQKAEYEATFYAALVRLLGPEGAERAFADYESDQQAQYAAEAAARAAAYAGGPVLAGDWALPLQGRFTSCFCERWGTMHWGIDIAAPLYTPEYAAGDGIVIQAGSATGFGQAVYIQHDNGDVTVYGHMSVIEVATGQRVRAGQEIALVGSEGFSTGPHLHFEVRVGGIDGVRVDPVQWLAYRGIFV